MTTRPGPEGSAVRHEVEGPRIEDALYQAFPNTPVVHGVDPVDGLPRPVVTTPIEDAHAPKLDPEKHVCMADRSSFVVRDDWGEVTEKHEPDLVERTEDGRYRLTLDHEREVFPIRPQCRHYARQQIPFPEHPEATLTVRLCTARRTDEGEFLDVGNTTIFACELRAPAFGGNAEKIEQDDEKMIREARERQVNDDFDVARALETENQGSADDDV